MPRRDLRLLAGAVFLSAVADVLALIVLALQVHELTGSGLAVSALFATRLGPMVALAPLAGLVTDRFESVRVLAAASLAQALVAVALAFSGEMATILALSSLLSAGNAFAQPAEFTLIPAVAGGRSTTETTGVLEAARYTGFAAGPALAAAVTALGPRPALLLTAVCLAGIAVAAGAMSARRPGSAPSESERQRPLDGLRLLRRDRVLRVTTAAGVGALLFISAALTVEIFYVKDVVGASDAGYALVLTAWMAGMVLGATALARRVPARLAAVGALVALAVQGAGMGAQAAWTILPFACAGYLVGGVGHGVKNVLVRALVTLRVPEAVHGRAFAAYNAVTSVAEVAALAGGGVLVGALGPRAALVVAGLGPIVAALLGLTALRWRVPAPVRRSLRRFTYSAPSPPTEP
jgi:Na+/melibiose symporter-like transporter